MKIAAPFLIFSLVLISCQSSTTIDRAKAIELAEQFVKDNGFTAAAADENKVVFDIKEDANNLKEVLQSRRNTLHPKAYYYTETPTTWSIGFIETQIDLSQLKLAPADVNMPGKAIVVEKDGSALWIAHKAPLFSSWKKLY